jgi:ribose 5-phosphate isomerase B
MSTPVRSAVGSDHAGFRLKQRVAEHLKSRGFAVVDVGTHDEERCDYPDFGAAVARAVCGDDAADLGVCVCGTGIGIAIAANKVPGARAAVVHDATTGRLTRQHNDANIVCVGSRTTGEETALDAIDAWLDASFEGGRHAGRVAKLAALETRD